MVKVVEVTKENEDKYLDQIAELEVKVLKVMEEEGKIGQLFITGKEDISEYVQSEENTVMVGLGDDEKVESATYITQGQKPFTYNDITKYFKTGKKYKEYVKSQYPDKKIYRKALLDTYRKKLYAFKYAKRKILEEHPEEKSIHDYLEKELRENGFHEKSELRDKINQYMSEYIENNCDEKEQKQYEQFYWTNIADISEEFGIEQLKMNISDLEKEYEEILQHEKLKIYEPAVFDETKYYSANTSNAIELDTYLTTPGKRNVGSARVIVFEGMKKHMEKFFENPENKEIFLCSTLHRDNLSSKYVSEFFGLTDSLFVNRRQGRNREVHICGIKREQAKEYLEHMENKLAVLYGYNPNNKPISKQEQKEVLQEQLRYEEKEKKRLLKPKKTDKKFKQNKNYLKHKNQKILELKDGIKKLSEEEGR